MTFEELLQSLGYAGSPCFLKRGDGVFETEMGYGHIFRRAKSPEEPQASTPPRWQAEGVYGIRESTQSTGRFTPIVYVCSAKDDDAAAELHRLLWNQDVAPYIIVYTTRGVRVYSGFNYSPKAKKAKDQGILAALTDFDNVQSIIEQFRRREIDEGRLWQRANLRVDPSQRVYHRLLASLRELDKSLQIDDGLSKEVSHALIGKYVYLRYLRDRGILSDDRLKVWGLKVDDIFGANAKKRSLSVLTERLDEWLNGEVFPLPWRGKSAPTAAQIQAVAGAFRGDEYSAQGTQTQLFDPYDFSFIPIETLSLVYEQFLHSEDLSAEKGTKTKKTKGRQEGAYYTPLPLVNFMLASLERQRPLRRGMKVLDPSCGSGSFLVQAYRLLIENTFPYSKQRPKPGQLRDLLEESIFGCDVDGDACQVTQLSLLLTLLDYVDPPDLRGSRHAFKLPTLCQTEDEEKRAAGHTPNILNHNFFGVEPLLAAGVVRKQGAKADWSTQGFDWIVGNPPWKNLSPKKLGENDAPVWNWMKTNATSMPVGDNQAAQAFAWELGNYLREGGECALLIPAMGLFDKQSSEFRRNFFRSFQVYEVANFSNFARVLFDGRAEVPTAAINYRKRLEGEMPDPDELIAVFSPFVVNQEATRPLEEGKRGKIWSLSVNATEVRSLELRDIASGSGLPWKFAMWGSPWDERLLQKLEKKWPLLGQMEAKWDRESEVFISNDQDQVLGVSEGLQLTSPSRNSDQSEDLISTKKPNPITEVSGAKMLDMAELNRFRNIFVLPSTALKTLEKRDWYGREGRVSLPLAICRGPHVIVSAARNFAVYHDEFLVVPPRQIGVASCKNDSSLLKALSLFLSSDFAFYHQFFRSTQMGIKFEVATLKALREMPVPIANLTREELKEWTDLHAKLAKCKPRKLANSKNKADANQSDFFESTEPELDSLLERLNQMTADALGLSPEERSLIHDFVQVRYALNDGKRGYAAMRPPEPDELVGYAKTLKDELDDFAGDFAGRSHRVTVVTDAESAMIEIDFTKDHRRALKPEVLPVNAKEAKALQRTRERLLEDESAWQWTYFNRNLRIYRGRKTYLFKPLNRFHWTQSVALTDASQVIAETLSGC